MPSQKQVFVENFQYFLKTACRCKSFNVTENFTENLEASEQYLSERDETIFVLQVSPP